eukprot:1048446-Pelagomonas_calceolata.AAC.3
MARRTGRYPSCNHYGVESTPVGHPESIPARKTPSAQKNHQLVDAQVRLEGVRGGEAQGADEGRLCEQKSTTIVHVCGLQAVFRSRSRCRKPIQSSPRIVRMENDLLSGRACKFRTATENLRSYKPGVGAKTQHLQCGPCRIAPLLLASCVQQGADWHPFLVKTTEGAFGQGGWGPRPKYGHDGNVYNLLAPPTVITNATETLNKGEGSRNSGTSEGYPDLCSDWKPCGHGKSTKKILEKAALPGTFKGRPDRMCTPRRCSSSPTRRCVAPLCTAACTDSSP